MEKTETTETTETYAHELFRSALTTWFQKQLESWCVSVKHMLRAILVCLVPERPSEEKSEESLEDELTRCAELLSMKVALQTWVFMISVMISGFISLCSQFFPFTYLFLCILFLIDRHVTPKVANFIIDSIDKFFKMFAKYIWQPYEEKIWKPYFKSHWERISKALLKYWRKCVGYINMILTPISSVFHQISGMFLHYIGSPLFNVLQTYLWKPYLQPIWERNINKLYSYVRPDALPKRGLPTETDQIALDWKDISTWSMRQRDFKCQMIALGNAYTDKDRKLALTTLVPNLMIDEALCTQYPKVQAASGQVKKLICFLRKQYSAHTEGSWVHYKNFCSEDMIVQAHTLLESFSDCMKGFSELSLAEKNACLKAVEPIVKNITCFVKMRSETSEQRQGDMRPEGRAVPVIFTPRPERSPSPTLRANCLPKHMALD